MATVVITPEMQRANAEALLGNDPGKFRDPGQRWTAKRYAEILTSRSPSSTSTLSHSRSMAVSFSLKKSPRAPQANLIPCT